MSYSIVLGTNDNERAHSRMKLLRTALRSKLRVEHLTHGHWTASATSQDGRAFAVHGTHATPQAAADALAALIGGKG